MRNGHRYQTKCTTHNCWCSLLLNPLLRSDRTGRPLHILTLALVSCASERGWYGTRVCLGVQNGRWPIWQVFYKYCKAIKIGPSRERVWMKKSKVLCFSPSPLFSVVAVPFHSVLRTPRAPSTVTGPRRRPNRRSLAWQPSSWRPEGWWCHSCGEREHCHWAAAMWGRSHRPTWCRCTPCRVTLGWEGGKDGCWELWHSCSLWAIHSASENREQSA